METVGDCAASIYLPRSEIGEQRWQVNSFGDEVFHQILNTLLHLNDFH